jgi:diguanylate cyclase (GGDEF)-like protein/hemerythrin-like metal-binding protein/PAS domain S-box-containing protein
MSTASPLRLNQRAGCAEILDALAIAACLTDASGSILIRNEAFAQLTGLEPHELETTSELGGLVSGVAGQADGPAAFAEWLRRAEEDGRHERPLYCDLNPRNGSQRPVRVRGREIEGLLLLSFEDLADDHQLPAELSQIGLPYRTLVEHSLVGIFVLRGDALSYVNERFVQLFGCAPDDLIGRTSLPDLAGAEDAAAVAERLRLLREMPGEENAFVFGAVRRDGALIDVEVTARALVTGRDGIILGAASDVTERVRAERQLAYLAFHDSLTGLPNRALLFDRLNEAIKRARRYGCGFGLMMLDLDGFKGVNDVHGHEAGDTVLRIIGQRLAACVRQSDTVARMGGDEFALVLHETREREGLVRLAERLVGAVRQPIEVAGRSCEVGVCIGIAIYSGDRATMDTLMSRADSAMYAQKRSGLAGYTFFQEGVHPDRAQEIAPLIRWSPEQELRIAVIDEQHQQLAAMVNELAVAVAAAEDTARLHVLLSDLGRCAAHHFMTEEGFMDRHQIPNARKHKEQHRKLMGDLAAIQRQIGYAELSRTLSAVRTWFLGHVQGSDRQLCEELRAHGEH